MTLPQQSDLLAPPAEILPRRFRDWFAKRGWAPHAHQLALLEAVQGGRSALLVAPTGGGKTLAGFLPSLTALAEAPRPGLRSLYISPLKALAQDIHRNLQEPIAEMGLAITAETRTGDTPAEKRKRQRAKPPHLLLTTPESLALLLSYSDAGELFGGLEQVIVDETHALAGGKRGDLLALGLARLQSLAPGLRRIGLSATVADPEGLAGWLSPSGRYDPAQVALLLGRSGARAEVEILETEEGLPWAGHMARHALEAVYRRVAQARTALIFVNTRAQAEIVFRELWHINEDTLAIALHHGSLDVQQRRKVEAAMAAGRLRAVVATSSLDLGIDWAAVDLVVQIGAPKGVARLVQRIGRANHRLDQPSRALLVPANRFEVLECRAAVEAVAARELDGGPPRPGGLDVLAQHMMGRAAGAPFAADELYGEVRRAQPYGALSRTDFDETLAFVETGGYALKRYERFRRLVKGKDGLHRVATPRMIQRYRMNVGTIVEEPLVTVRMKNGRKLGEVEEYFIQALLPGDTFLFAGQLLTFLGLKETDALVAKGGKGDPAIPAYAGGRLPMTTELAARVRSLLESPGRWENLPPEVRQWLSLQRYRSQLPPAQGLLVESFPRAGREFLVAYCFEGRNAHQTLGMLLTRRLERAGCRPQGFVASDYAIATWSLRAAPDVPALFSEEMLGDDLEEWMAESSLLRRSFRNVAIVAGLLERRQPGQEKSGRQMTVSSDLIYDVLRKYQPDHLLLRATRAEAAGGLTDIRRLADMLMRVKGKIRHRRLTRVSPLAVPVLLDIGKVQVAGGALDSLLDEAADALIAEAMADLPDDLAEGPGQQAELPL
ncbi:MAG: ligase-associated DNA damage response DEXH box helicase [Rhodospirillales bacterium]